MTLRPISFQINSSTQISLLFSHKLSLELNVNNFEIESLGGNSESLTIKSIEINSSEVKINTNPHTSGCYYLLKLKDSSSQLFLSEDGFPLINDSSSREIFFIGIEKYNPIRDDMLLKVPSIYNLDGSTVKNIIDVQAEELYKAQNSIGQLLNDNYISETVNDEVRIRGSGATDRLSNENAFDVISISKFRAGENSFSSSIEVNASGYIPINLRQEEVQEEELTYSSSTSFFNGFILNLSKSNILKVKSIKLITSSDVEDCNGDIGTFYDIKAFKYTIKDNKYDPYYAFKNEQLEKNQVVLSDFGNWIKPSVGDIIKISYTYDDLSKKINPGSISVYTIDSVINESVPSNASNFFLKNAPIVSSLGEVVEIGGIEFKQKENDPTTPKDFSTELIYNFSFLPKNSGEFSVNYQNGEVFVVGSKPGIGTGYNYYYCSYNYKKIYTLDLDYYVYNHEVGLNTKRQISKSNIVISFSYDSILEEGYHYESLCHKEVINENVFGNYYSSFVIKAEKQPVTSVFRIYNQTTGEVYNPISFLDDKITFTGNNPPKAKSISNEHSSFKRIYKEDLLAIGETISPILNGSITSNNSNNLILFSPSVPAEFFEISSTNYYIRVLNNLTSEYEDIKISYFHSPNSENMISGFALPVGATIPSIGSSIIIGAKVKILNLKNINILNEIEDGLGSFLNSSLLFSDDNIFKNEKYFIPVNDETGLKETSPGSMMYIITSTDSENIYQNISKLRANGEYQVDYKHGLIYIVTEEEKYYGEVDYSCAIHTSQFSNIFKSIGATKKIISKQEIELSYSNLTNNNEEILLNDIDKSYYTYGSSVIFDENGIERESLIVNDDYTIYTDYNITSVRSINKLSDLFGDNLTSAFYSSRSLEKSKEDLLRPIKNDGYNYFSEIVSFSENIIDLKQNINSKIIQNSGFYIRGRVNNASQVYSIVDNNSDTIYLDNNYNFVTNKSVEVVSIENYSDEEYKVFLPLPEKFQFNDGYDFIGSEFLYWKINDYGDDFVIINKTSYNNYETFDLNSVDFIIRPDILISSGQFSIYYPENNYMEAGLSVKSSFISGETLSPGTAVGIDYSYGEIFFDYISITDSVIISYEYGDNEIKWLTDENMLQGEQYFVSYRYGALRSSLRKNFGRLTNIPFFNTAPLTIDRELYRDALSGVLTSYPLGPTIPAITNLINSIVKTKPEIQESFFGNWILGRDCLTHNTVSYTGNLSFQPGKFDSGLFIGDENNISIPAISNLSFDEGTIEAWVRPSWSGIDNDATLTFNFENIGQFRDNFYGGQDPFSLSHGYDALASNDESTRGFDKSGGALTIFNRKSEPDGYEEEEFVFGIFNKNRILNRLSKSKINLELKINDFYFNEESSLFVNWKEIPKTTSTKVLINDEYKKFELSYHLDPIINDTVGVFFNTDYEKVWTDLPDYQSTATTEDTYYSLDIDVHLLEKFPNLEVEIKLNSPIPANGLSQSFVGEMVDATPELFQVLTLDNKIYQISSFKDSYGKIYNNSIPSVISSIFIKRYPVNNPELSSKSYEEINSINIDAFILLRKTISVNLLKNNSKTFFNTKKSYFVNWSKKRKYSVYLDPKTNESFFEIDKKYNFFYTDLDNYNYESFFDQKTKNTWSIITYNNSSIDIFKLFVSIDNHFDFNNIFIGKNNYSPTKNNFSLNRNSEVIDAVGIPSKSDISEGIFIGYDPTCSSPTNDLIGQWVIRSKILKNYNLPYDVIISSESYDNVFEDAEVRNEVRGMITTDGDFSSITRSYKSSNKSCEDGFVCSNKFRFFGTNNLITDGWSLVEPLGVESEYILDRETSKTLWTQIGNFQHGVYSKVFNIEGPYDINSPESNYDSIGMIAENTCSDGNISLTIGLQIISDYSQFNYKISDDIFTSGQVIAEIRTTKHNIMLLPGLNNSGDSIIILYDKNNNSVISYNYFDWSDLNFHQYNINIEKKTELLSVLIDEENYFIINLKSILEKEILDSDWIINPYIAIWMFHKDFCNIETQILTSNLELKIDIINLDSFNEAGSSLLEDNDVFIVSDNVANFIFRGGPNYIGIDGYEEDYDIDEILITSDTRRYLFDTGESEFKNRMSLFKDGMGFLNFRVWDNTSENYFNLSTSIKHFIPGELHHLAASWRFNSNYDQNEMHIFIDGYEAPNIYKFGGKVPLKINAKFADVSEETLYNFKGKKIIFSSEKINGSITAGSNLFSTDYLFDSSLVGRTIIFKESAEGSIYVNKAFIILSVDNNVVSLGNIDTLESYIFDSSANDIIAEFPPHTSYTNTDLKYDRFSIFRLDFNNSLTEYGGISYRVNDGIITITDKESVITPSFRYNEDTRVIEFIKYDNYNCIYIKSVDLKDIDIHIKSYGLNKELISKTIELSGSSVITDDNIDETIYANSENNLSIIRSPGPRPKSLLDVSIKRMLLNKYIVDASTYSFVDDSWCSLFEKTFDSDFNKTILETVNLSKNNYGRLISIDVDGDNIDFSKENFITIYGETVSGPEEEVIPINANKVFKSSIYWTMIEKISGIFNLVSEFEDFCSIISVYETDDITTQNNGGDFAYLYDYNNGSFVISKSEYPNYSAFELPSGWYKIEYPGSLGISVFGNNKKIKIGSSINDDGHWNGVVDNFRIYSQMLYDIRDYQNISTSNSITQSYLRNKPYCKDELTLALIEFENPIKYQSRRLRNQLFLKEETNEKYKLDLATREILLKYINKENDFISKMLNMGFSKDEATKTFFESHMANNGPIENYSDYIIINDEIMPDYRSVNSNFEKSARFDKKRVISFNDDGRALRKNSGTIEFWTSPLFDTYNDHRIWNFFESIPSITTKVISERYNVIKTPSPASKIISISINDDSFGKKTFHNKLKIAADGKTIYLSENLPSANQEVVVTYIPKYFSGNKISLFKDPYNRIIFMVSNNDKTFFSYADIDWDKNSWHRIACSFNFEKNKKTIKLYVDGKHYKNIYMTSTSDILLDMINIDNATIVKKVSIEKDNDTSMLSFGNNFSKDYPANSLIDNLRISRIDRSFPMNSAGEEIDINYTENINSIYPVSKDDLTTYINNFDDIANNYANIAKIIDPKYGIFNFDVNIDDSFDRALEKYDGQIEDLIIDLINRLKPAHTNGVVNFNKKKCVE